MYTTDGDDSEDDVDVTVTEDDSDDDELTETPRVKTPRRCWRVVSRAQFISDAIDLQQYWCPCGTMYNYMYSLPET